MAWLLDTNILSELARPVVNPGVKEWALAQSVVHLSVVTVEEILYGLSWKPNNRVQAWFDRFLDEGPCQILPVSVAVARVCGTLRGSHQSRGETRSQADMLIAATAAVHGLTVVTRNTADFHGCGIPLLNPFSLTSPQ